MDDLQKNLQEVGRLLSKIKLWAAVAGFCAAVLLGVYSFLGWQYWEALDESKTMQQQIGQISRKLDRGVPSAEQVEHDLAIQQQELERLQDIFEDPDVARLMGIVSTTSWDTNVDLPSISAGDPVFKQVGGMEYRTQVLTITARGDIHNMYLFLASLHEKLPVVSVPNISIANPGTEEATAQVQLVFYLSPQLISDKGSAD